jgi:ubiquinone/menaquinone biosynthesis C-methylase UbiE
VTDESTGPRAPAFAGTSVSEHYQRDLAPIVFEPWAQTLVETVGIADGDRILDVASGTGVVARLAARHAGPTGQVLAIDISATMLAHAAAQPSAAGAARTEYVEGSAMSLPVGDATVDVAVCQQGLQFFPDRLAAVAEMRRALRPGGRVALAVWSAGSRLEPFDDYSEVSIAAGLEPPFPGAFANASYVMEADAVRALLVAAGFASIEVSVVSQELVWPAVEPAVAGILGTPFGGLVQALPAQRRAALEDDLRRRFGAAPIRRASTAVIAQATA